jgi:hypothetical protein
VARLGSASNKERMAGHLIRQWLARLRWPLAGLAALLVVLACVLVVRQWLVRWELGDLAHTLSAADHSKAIKLGSGRPGLPA